MRIKTKFSFLLVHSSFCDLSLQFNTFIFLENRPQKLSVLKWSTVRLSLAPKTPNSLSLNRSPHLKKTLTFEDLDPNSSLVTLEGKMCTGHCDTAHCRVSIALLMFKIVTVRSSRAPMPKNQFLAFRN